MTVLAAIIYFLFFFKWPGESPINTLVDNVKTINNLVNNNSLEEKSEPSIKENKQEEDILPPSGEDVEREKVVKTALAFAERFGSYSNQSNFGNITDLRLSMTDKMRNWADQYIAENEKNNSYNNTYQGMVTKAISSDVENFNQETGNAELTVHTQRIASSGDFSQTDVYYEDIIIKMVRENGFWKVDSAYWQGRK